MWNRIDSQLSAADLQLIINQLEQVTNDLPQKATLTEKQTKKGGWYHSKIAFEMAKKTLRSVKESPSFFPHLNANNFEKDIEYLKSLKIISMKIENLKIIVEQTERVLMKEINEQASYAYQLIKIMHDNGIPEGNAYKELKALMPKTGSKKKKEI